MTHKHGLGSFLSAALVLLAGASLAAGLHGAEAQKDRETHMKEMGKAAKAMRDSLVAGSAAPAVIKPEADKIVAGSKALITWFPKGSGQEVAPKSRALPVVWTDWSAFQAKAHDFELAAAKLDAVSGSGDVAKIGAAMKEVGGACKGCHEKFQAPEKD
jgi:cytochrome c556